MTSGTAKATVMSEKLDATPTENVANWPRENLGSLTHCGVVACRMPTTDVKEWLHHWQDEADAAFLYLALAGQEPDPHRKDVYIKLAGVEERHVQMWTKLLAEHGHTVDHAKPSLNAAGDA